MYIQRLSTIEAFQLPEDFKLSEFPEWLSDRTKCLKHNKTTRKLFFEIMDQKEPLNANIGDYIYLRSNGEFAIWPRESFEQEWVLV